VEAGFSYPFEDKTQDDVAVTPRQHTHPLAPLPSRHSRRCIRLAVPTVVVAEIALATLQVPEQRIGTKKDYF
jgi:hypothetical protein